MNNLSSLQSDAIGAIADLEAIYDTPGWGAFASEIDHVNEQYRAFIESAPFVTIATSGPKGVDCSARSGEAGFVKIQDERTLLLPDRPGNNRVDSLHNLIHDSRIALLFLIPGCRETLRIKGRAAVCNAPDLILLPSQRGEKPPKSMIVISVESVHFQCAGAVKWARLWERTTQQGAGLPSPNGIPTAIKWHGLRQALRLPRKTGGRANKPQAQRRSIGDIVCH